MNTHACASLLALAFFTVAAAGQAQDDLSGSDTPEPEVLTLRNDPVRVAETLEARDHFWFVGTSNYHIKLDESEAMIDSMLNGPLRLLLPRWEEPTTFKDWMEDFIVWDLWGGYGGDINPHWSWTVYAGGGLGTIHNTEDYCPLGVPLKFDINFTRRSFMLGTSIVWHPWGRPQKTGRGFGRALKDSRPMFEMNVGYNDQISKAHVTVSVPVFHDLAQIKIEDRYHLLWASPRAGIEIPLTRTDSLNLLTGYLFFSDHGDEYNGLILEGYVRHRF